jgi:uncharacterized protein (DUF1684 family)
LKYIVTTNGLKKYILSVKKVNDKYRTEFPGFAYYDYNVIGERVTESYDEAEGWPTKLALNKIFKTEEEATITAYDLKF